HEKREAFTLAVARHTLLMGVEIGTLTDWQGILRASRLAVAIDAIGSRAGSPVGAIDLVDRLGAAVLHDERELEGLRGLEPGEAFSLSGRRAWERRSVLEARIPLRNAALGHFDAEFEARIASVITTNRAALESGLAEVGVASGKFARSP